MLSRILMLFSFPFFAALSFAAAPLPDGHDLRSKVCASKDSGVFVTEPASHILQVDFLDQPITTAIDCRDDGVVYLLGSGSLGGDRLEVVTSLPRRSSTVSFVYDKLLIGNIVSFYDHPKDMVSTRDLVEMIFYRESNTPHSCPERQLPLAFQRLLYSSDPFQKPQITSVCVRKDISLPNRADVPEPLMRVIDYSWDNDQKILTGLLKLPGQLLGFQVNPKDAASFQILFDVSGPTYFPPGCGLYFMAARIDPVEQKVLMFYKDPAVRVLEYGAGRSVRMTEIYNGDDQGFASCEGYHAVHASLRDDITVDWRSEATYFRNFNEIEGRLVLTELP